MSIDKTLGVFNLRTKMWFDIDTMKFSSREFIATVERSSLITLGLRVTLKDYPSDSYVITKDDPKRIAMATGQYLFGNFYDIPHVMEWTNSRYLVTESDYERLSLEQQIAIANYASERNYHWTGFGIRVPIHVTIRGITLKQAEAIKLMGGRVIDTLEVREFMAANHLALGDFAPKALSK